MPTAALGAGGPVVSRIGLGLAALGRPAYITSGREEDLPDRSVAGLRARTFSMLDAAYAAGVGRSGRPGHGTELFPSPPPDTVTSDRTGKAALGAHPALLRERPHTLRILAVTDGS